MLAICDIAMMTPSSQAALGGGVKNPQKVLTFFMNGPEWNGSVIGGWHPVLSPLVCVLEQLCKCLLHYAQP